VCNREKRCYKTGSVLEFRVLGPLEVLSEGEAVPVAGQRQRALLTLLLLHAGEVLSTDRLVDRLWGEAPPRTATTSLQNAIAQLRKLFGADVVRTKPPGYVLDLDGNSLDLRRFEELVGRSRRTDPEERAQLLREALGLWRGEPLAEVMFEPFADEELPRLLELRLATLEDRIDADLELGRHADVAGELESLIRRHPLRERMRAQLMLALYRAGRQADALQAYQDARKALVAELGIEPGRALQDLHAAILRQDAKLDGATRARRGDDHVGDVARELLAGHLVPVIGADVAELAAELARLFDIPGDPQLPYVSQHIAVMRGAGPLYDELHERFVGAHEPSPVHRFFASLPPLLRDRGAPHQLVVTTSYDVALEQAFTDAGEEFDVVAYVAEGRNRGRFCHMTSDGGARVIEEPNTYGELSLERRTVILRLHGRVDTRPERDRESFVVTEDDYIHYLGNGELTSVVPVALVAKLRRSHFLFLGYVLREWNLRVVLHRLWGDQRVNYRSWAVHSEPTPLEEAFWRQRDVAVVDRAPVDYVEALAGGIGALRPVEATG
jgi:DNA-binding SARP family transcriptional activator